MRKNSVAPVDNWLKKIWADERRLQVKKTKKDRISAAAGAAASEKPASRPELSVRKRGRRR